MKLEKFERKHYETLLDWWEQHGHPVIPYESLSPIGLVVNDNGNLTCVSFLYVMHGCDLAQIAWTTTNPTSGLKKKHESVGACLHGLYGIAKQNKRTNIICFSSSTGLTKLIKRHGFNVGHTHDLLAGVLEE